MTDGPLRILLVEDNLGDAVLLREALSDAREYFEVSRAGTLAEGLACVHRGAVDVVLLDLSLPDSSGMITVEKATASAGSVPIIVLTGLDDEEAGIEAVRKGAQDYLVKGKAPTDLLVRAIHYAVERKGAEQALRDSEERHRTILDEMQEGVIFADAQDIVRHANAWACALVHTTRDQVVGRNILSVHPESLRPRCEEILRTFRQEPGRRVITVRRSFGDREVILRFSPVTGPGNSYWGIITTIVDVTELVRAQQRLAEARRLESVGTLAGGIAHDFNNLMATVLGRASHLRARHKPDDADYESLSEIERAADTAGRLAHQLLVYAKGGKIVPRIVSFADVVARATNAFRASLPETVELDCQLADGLGQVECDVTQMEQVIRNLCRNAVEAMPQGGRLIIRAENATLKAPLEEAHPRLVPGEYVRVAVEDTGCGMDLETAKRAFDPFFTTKPTGYGLGLAAAWGIVKSHNGGISMTTLLGAGSTFSVWLPRVQVEEHAEENVAHRIGVG